MRITRLRIGQPGFVESVVKDGAYRKVRRRKSSTMPPDDENNYWAEAIEDGGKFTYRVNDITVEITEYDYQMVTGNPSLYYFSTALKLHNTIKRERQPQDDSTISELTNAGSSLKPETTAPQIREFIRPVLKLVEAPLPASDPVVLQYFEVTDCGTIYDSSLEPFSKPRSEAYDVNPERDIVSEAENCPPLVSHLQDLASCARDELAELIDSKSLNLVERKEAQLRYDLLEDEDDGWKAWCKTLSRRELDPIRESIRDWLSKPPSALQEDDYIPDYLRPQAGPMSLFQDMDSEITDALNIRIIQGQHPGSTYYAAELHSPIETANQICEEKGLWFRFKAEGKTK